MIERIKLTEPILIWDLNEVMPQYEEPQFVGYFLRKEDLDNHIKGTGKIWQYGSQPLDRVIAKQILDDQEKAKYVNPFYIQQVKKIKLENKQLKELNRLNLEHWKELVEDKKRIAHTAVVLKQKLEKIIELCNEDQSDYATNRFAQIIKEIAKKKNNEDT